MTNQDFGRASEARFLKDACERGFTVSRPFSEAPGYDAVVDAGGKLSRVQIKGIGTVGFLGKWKRTARQSVVFYRSARKPTKPLCDVVAIWIQRAQRWVFVPGEITMRKTLQVRTDGKGLHSHVGWEIFK